MRKLAAAEVVGWKTRVADEEGWPSFIQNEEGAKAGRHAAAAGPGGPEGEHFVLNVESPGMLVKHSKHSWLLLS